MFPKMLFQSNHFLDNFPDALEGHALLSDGWRFFLGCHTGILLRSRSPSPFFPTLLVPTESSSVVVASVIKVRVCVK